TQEFRTNSLHLGRDRTVIENGIGRRHELLAVLHVPRVQRERIDHQKPGRWERHALAPPLRGHPVAVEHERSLLEPVALLFTRAQRLAPPEQRRAARAPTAAADDT